ncbi:hypothetical protein OS493_020084 [Desmophyllum pertusum]|uniref:Uncharacterized protein n=1 Tax=Desmophyllum pertusum TaxID=174260 RepID=A0A9W9YBN8_9CNID|nr:hypothetical protein OS493_020084 [Desmophyllum pertusum]
MVVMLIPGALQDYLQSLMRSDGSLGRKMNAVSEELGKNSFGSKMRWFLHFQHVDPTQAVCIHQDIQSRCSLGIHWGTFPTGYEHFMDPPKDLSEALKSKEIPETTFFTMKHGETRVIK